MKPLSHRERDPSEIGHSIIFRGGKNDGEEFRMVEVTMSDGTLDTSREWLFASNARDGYFKQVFVPWDFEHPEIV